MGFLSRASVITAKIKAGVKEKHLQLTEEHHICLFWLGLLVWSCGVGILQT